MLQIFTRENRFQEIAKATVRKDKKINIRISKRVLMELKRQAYYAELPYQTCTSS